MNCYVLICIDCKKEDHSRLHHPENSARELIPHHANHGLKRLSSQRLALKHFDSDISSGGNSGMNTPKYGHLRRQASNMSTISPPTEGEGHSLSRMNSLRSPSPNVKMNGGYFDEHNASEGEDDLTASSGGTDLLKQNSGEHTMIQAARNPNDKATSKSTANAAMGYSATLGNASNASMETGEFYDCDGVTVNSELMTYMLLERAINTTKDEDMKRVIREVIEHMPGLENLLNNSNYTRMKTTTTDSLMHAEVHEDEDEDLEMSREGSITALESNKLEGELWKKGKFLHLWSKRYYILSDNCMYYYDSNNKEDMTLKGVIFLTGCLINTIESDVENEVKGYYGFELMHPEFGIGEHHKHEKRVFYCKSEDERTLWLSALQHAAEVVPIENDWVIGRELGKGRFSVVKECVHVDNNKHCAVKVIDKRTIEAEDKGLMRTEISVLIIRLEGIYESKHYIYIVMEKLEGGELFERIVGRPRFTEVEAARLIKPLLEAVAYLHDLGIAHRDLKPENVLCGESMDDIKIADFGLSKMVLPDEKMEGACGTLSYVAPEVLSMQGYGMQADVWSIGVILFLVLCGKLPFDGDDQNDIIRKTVQCEPLANPSVWAKLSKDSKKLLLSIRNASLLANA